ncbi:MAG: siderophore-interacting protein [Bacteriovorax sp.]|nr:siderophore-interacting protein [Bacteriovorax sp.]
MGLIKKFALKLFRPLILSETKIISNERLSPHFHLLTIRGKSLKKAEWTPGQKIKIVFSDDQSRSYTPSSWNFSSGELQTLVYIHGKGPGAIWARDVKPASNVTIRGPKHSIEINDSDKNILFFGDETTFGLSCALKKFSVGKHFYFFFESGIADESLLVLKHFELDDSRLYSLEQLETAANEMIKLFNQTPEARIILSGKQQSIVTLREKLYAGGIPQDKISKKVYWGHKDDPNGKLKN